eukprot:TRINITY_DN3079_c0_g1_i6.p1 TRINITY_DN3079_c0_g1~~TRINITY_DN3079_c0_g1_i6.p1  ORF type:complete len:151 (-),score=34.91 TRINITY_DN3079_c0_g1_i6:159-611(-)
MYITKQPHIGGDVTPHQDSTFIYTEPESCVAFWWPVEKATKTNSCLWVVPGSHTAPLKTRMMRNKDDESKMIFYPKVEQDSWPEQESYIPVEVDPGDLVVIHGRLIHKSSENLSNYSRHAYTIHMIDGSTTWSKDNWLQRSTPFPPLERP